MFALQPCLCTLLCVQMGLAAARAEAAANAERAEDAAASTDSERRLRMQVRVFKGTHNGCVSAR